MRPKVRDHDHGRTHQRQGVRIRQLCWRKVVECWCCCRSHPSSVPSAASSSLSDLCSVTRLSLIPWSHYFECFVFDARLTPACNSRLTLILCSKVHAKEGNFSMIVNHLRLDVGIEIWIGMSAARCSRRPLRAASFLG